MDACLCRYAVLGNPQGDGDGKAGTVPRFRLHPNFPAHQRQDSFRERQAKTAAPILSGHTLLRLLEDGEECALFFFTHSNTGIFYGNADDTGIATQA